MSIQNGLSEREKEILRWVATGASNKEIAHRLAISPNTVKVHLRSIFAKIEVASRTEATLFAVRNGLVEPAALQASEEQPQPAVRARRSYAVYLLAALLLLALSSLGFLGLDRLRGAAAATATAAIRSPLERWGELAGLPAGRRSMAAAAFENQIYLIGGETAGGVTNSVIRYEAAANRWGKARAKPTAVSQIQAAVLGEAIYVPGGCNADGRPIAALEVYRPLQNRWEEHARLPRPLCAYALAAYEGRLYLFGGWDGQSYRAEVYAYDPLADEWTEKSRLPAGMGYAAAVTGEGKILVIGGYDGQNAHRQVLAYYPQRDLEGSSPWEERAPLPAGRYAAGVAALANRYYLIGGLSDDPAGEGLPSLEYLPQRERWITFDEDRRDASSHAAVLSLDTRLHILGGSLPTGLSAHHLTYQAIYTIMIPIIP